MALTSLGENIRVQQPESVEPLLGEPAGQDSDDDEEPPPSMVLIGRVGNAYAYYTHLRNAIMLGSLSEGQLTEERFIKADDTDYISDHVKAFVETANESDEEWWLSGYGIALYVAAMLAELKVIGQRQAEVYALREIYDTGRQETAAVLNLAPSTVDTTLRDASKRITEFENALRIVDDATEFRDELA